jgi:hypothetical protein
VGLTYLVPSLSPNGPAVRYIVALLGLDLPIDFSLLMVNRWREERAAMADRAAGLLRLPAAEHGKPGPNEQARSASRMLERCGFWWLKTSRRWRSP